MRSPVIYSTTGAVLSSGEIDFAHRVAASFSHQTKPDYVKIVRRVDPVTGAAVDYHLVSNIAYVTPGGAVDYVGVMMPNPVSYRGISIGVVGSLPNKTVMMTSQRILDPTTNGGINISTDWSVVFSDSLGNTLSTLTAHADYYPVEFGAKMVWINFMPEMSNGNDAYNPTGRPAIPLWEVWSGTVFYVSGVRSGAWSAISPTYEATIAAEHAAGGGVRTNVMTSDGTVLASEARNLIPNVIYPSAYDVAYREAQEISQLGMSTWNGGDNIWMFYERYSPGAHEFDHKLIFSVPEDCVYPQPPVTAPTLYNYNGQPMVLDGWDSDWAAGVFAFNTRRKAWLKKTSEETVAALKTGFALGAPGVTRAELQAGLEAAWGVNLKGDVDSSYTTTALGDGSIAGKHTKMPVVLSAVYVDSTESDTSAGLTQAGVKVTRRATTLEYIGADGTTRTQIVTGYLTQVVTQHTLSGANVGLSQVDTYLRWYTDQVDGNETSYQFILDGSSVGVGLLWDGIVQFGYNSTSKYGPPGNPLSYAGYVPPFPAYSNSLVGTAAALYLQYHNEIKPEYVKDTTLASTEMNNSALYGVTKIELSPIGCVTTESLGMFAHPDVASSAATRIELYGTAVYDFDWATGALTFNLWKPLLDVSGNEVASKIIDLPAGSTWGGLGTNCLITYRGLHWPDVKEYVKLRNTDMKSDTFAFTTPGFKALVDAVKAG